MTPKELDQSYTINKNSFHKYIDNIKKNMKVNFYSISNAIIIKNPYTTSFPNKFFSKEYERKNRIYQFFKSSLRFYFKQFYSFFMYLVSYILFRIYYRKSKLDLKNYIAIDVFFLVDNILEDKKFNENYFVGLYEVLEKRNKDYIFLPRLYGVNKNPFKLIKFFKIINDDNRSFLFEFELLQLKDLISIFFLILVYPFKTLNLLQKNNSDIDMLFNGELITDTGNFGFDAFSRYIFGKNIAKQNNIIKIYSWSEFQVVERCFNYGLRMCSNKIKLYGCQLYLNYETYFNAYIDEVDIKHKTAYDEILVNGKYYILDRLTIKYRVGVSLRYKNIFKFAKTTVTHSIIVLLGSYIEKDTKYMLESVSSFNQILFKNHPAVNINQFGKLDSNIVVVTDNIYQLFENAELVIGTASGTSVEAVACGVSVIIIASQENLTANPLVDYGKGKIWDIAFSKDDVKKLYNNLIEYRKNNEEEIKEIACWYKDNFFIEPTEDNIIKAFDLSKGI